MKVTFYAGAADAAGRPSAELDAGDLTAGQLTAVLGRDSTQLAEVLARCTLLVDGTPVRNQGDRIAAGARIDVLPPFAGG